MGKWSTVGIFLIPVLFGLGIASPDLGLNIVINLVTTGNPNVRAAANVVNSATSDLTGAMGGYQVPNNDGSTGLISSGQSLVTLISSITGTVNNVLRNISVIASQRQTAPSCMFASVNATIDQAYAFLDEVDPLLEDVLRSASPQAGGALASSMSLLMDALTNIAENLDALYLQVAAVVDGDVVNANTISMNIQQATLIQLSGSIAVVTTLEKGLASTVRSIRTAFEAAASVLTSYNNDLDGALNSIRTTQQNYYNQIVSRINSFRGKVTTDTNAGTNEIQNTQPKLNPFIQDLITRNSALSLEASTAALIVAVRSVADEYSSNIQSQMTQIFTGVEEFVASNTDTLVTAINAAAYNLAATRSAGGTFATSCNSRYSAAVMNLDNNMRDGLNRCMNDYASTAYMDAFVSEYNSVLREQTRTVAARINFCVNLGSASSNSIIKAGIAACLTSMVDMNAVLLNDITIQTQLLVAAINLESLAMIQRFESCAFIMNSGVAAKAAALEEMVTNCQTTNT